jgi:hypothetical protein
MIGPLPSVRRCNWTEAYDSGKTCDLLEILGYRAEIAVKGQPAPIQAGKHRPIERTHSWMNGYGELRRRIDKRKSIVEVYLYLAAALTVIRRLINRARTVCRWLTRPLAPPSVIPWARPGRFLPPFC